LGAKAFARLLKCDGDRGLIWGIILDNGKVPTHFVRQRKNVCGEGSAKGMFELRRKKGGGGVSIRVWEPRLLRDCLNVMVIGGLIWGIILDNDKVNGRMVSISK